MRSRADARLEQQRAAHDRLVQEERDRSRREIESRALALQQAEGEARAARLAAEEGRLALEGAASAAAIERMPTHGGSAGSGRFRTKLELFNDTAHLGMALVRRFAEDNLSARL